jgi:two-component system chemotaxis sensor kinase CheA
MKTRMQPIGNVWNKLPRVVRDLAQACGKHVALEMEGRDTELDKTVLEAIKDPLTHLVRNSVDHGIEAPEDRAEAGKPEEGRLLLRAYHESGLVNIEIIDDGAGIDVDKVRAKAIERGIINNDQAARMGDREVMNLIFQPGFSTAAKVTNVSGRGVGMDVVKTNIEKIGGTVDVQSRVGEGTTLKIKIPLTLAIIPALIVGHGEARYAIPQVSLLELVRLESEQAKKSIERIQGAPVYRLRGKLLPLVYLREALGEHAEDAQSHNEAVSIVVLQADEQQFGLVVERVDDTAEIVVKPLGKQLKGIPVFAGATIMGDGHVALILDVMGVAQRSKILSELHDKGLGAGEADAAARRKDGQTMLLVDAAGGRRIAVPLGAVARLEQFETSKLEWAGSQQVVQYTGELLPILSVASLLGFGAPESSDPIEVVVVWQGDRQVGLHVAEILDIVEDVELGRGTSTNPGIVGSVVIQDKVTDVLDMRAVVAAVDPSLLTDSRFEEARV